MSNPNLQQMMIQFWQSACQDRPERESCRVIDGQFVLTIKGNSHRWLEICKLAGVPKHASQEVSEEMLVCKWPSVADQIFGNGGLIAQHKAGYEMRKPQLYMARMVQRSIEMGQPAVIEAGTGTGKSFAYAAVAMALGKRTIISTSNKALQMQLLDKDLPFLQQIWPDRKVAVGIGKTNYACRFKAEATQAGNETLRKNPDLAEWYAETATGNTEEITVAVDGRALAAIVVDDECTGKHCPLYYACHYYTARAALKEADVIVTNHALLCLNQTCNGALLPPADLIVVDEAHKLADYARNTLGSEFTMPAIDRAINLARGWAEDDDVDEAERAALAFTREITSYLVGKEDAQVGVHKQDTFAAGLSLALCLGELAESIWSQDELPSTPEETKLAKRAQRIINMAGKVAEVSQDTGLVRWIEQNKRDDSPLKLCAKPHDVSAFIAALCGIKPAQATPASQEPVAQEPAYTKCYKCQRTLTAERVAILNGQPYGPECIKKVDAFGDAEVVSLADWLGMDHTAQAEAHAEEDGEEPVVEASPVVFCSATLAAPDMAHFMREAGLSVALQMVAESPFDYANNALLYLPNGASPVPSSKEWKYWLFEQLRSLVLAAKGGAFLLFTSYANMNECAYELRYTFAAAKLNVYIQGELPKAEIAKRFREDGNAVLFATKSFFEGVSIDGSALRLVVVDKMPFEAPTPLGMAMEASVAEHGKAQGLTGKALEMYPFNALRVPRMITDLKQATGRLIRTTTDQGVMAILDSRIRATQYGRNAVIPSLPPAALASNLESVERWFGDYHKPAPAISSPAEAVVASVWPM